MMERLSGASLRERVIAQPLLPNLDSLATSLHKGHSRSLLRLLVCTMFRLSVFRELGRVSICFNKSTKRSPTRPSAHSASGHDRWLRVGAVGVRSWGRVGHVSCRLCNAALALLYSPGLLTATSDCSHGLLLWGSAPALVQWNCGPAQGCPVPALWGTVLTMEQINCASCVLPLQVFHFVS